MQVHKVDFSLCELAYCGREGVITDPNGLVYMRARYYSPLIKRFINEDIVTGDIANSNSLNRYSYVEGNPATMIDPFGLCAERTKDIMQSALKGTTGMAWAIALTDIINKFQIKNAENLIKELVDNLDHVKKMVDTTKESWGHFRRATRSELKSVKNVVSECAEAGNELSKISKAFTVASVGLDVMFGIAENIDKGADYSEYISDAFCDIAISAGEAALAGVAGAKTGALAGTVIGPGPGNAIGAVTGFIVGVGASVAIDLYKDDNGETIRDKIKDWAYGKNKNKND